MAGSKFRKIVELDDLPVQDKVEAIVQHDYFPKVKAAREMLKARAIEIYEQLMQVTAMAAATQDYQTASANLKWLMEHIPADDDGTRVIDMSVDKPKIVEVGSNGPVVQFGFQIGGLNTPKELPPAQVIDVTPTESNEWTSNS